MIAARVNRIENHRPEPRRVSREVVFVNPKNIVVNSDEYIPLGEIVFPVFDGLLFVTRTHAVVLFGTTV